MVNAGTGKVAGETVKIWLQSFLILRVKISPDTPILQHDKSFKKATPIPQKKLISRTRVHFRLRHNASA
jgi:hypothetical protein